MKTKKLVCYNCGGHGFITAVYENGQTSAICPVCGGIGSHEIQMTNADYIRCMSNEELAVLIAREIVHVPHSGFYVAKSAWLRWLHETVEERDG